MIVALFNVYLVVLFILVKTKIVPFNLFWKCSPLIVLLLLMFGLFVPMGWGAPQGPAMVVRQSVQIVPNVAGEVTEVPVEPNKPLKAGDVLFKIDPVPYQSQVDSIGAQLKFEQLRLSQMTQLQVSDAGRAFDVEQRQADVDKLKGQLLGAKYNLDLYLMGLVSPSEVPDFFLLRNLQPVGRDANGHRIFKADRIKVTINDVIAAEAPREPDVDHAQKHFNTGMVIVLRHGDQPSPQLLKDVNGIRLRWMDYWTTVTGHRATMTTNP